MLGTGNTWVTCTGEARLTLPVGITECCSVSAVVHLVSYKWFSGRGCCVSSGDQRIDLCGESWSPCGVRALDLHLVRPR